MTGAILPRGCDTVVPVEQLRIADGEARLLDGPGPAPWRHVHRQAADAQSGDVLLEAGTRLGGTRARDRRLGGTRRALGVARATHRRHSRPAMNSSSRASRSSPTRCGARTPTASPPRSRSRVSRRRPTCTCPTVKDAHHMRRFALRSSAHDVLVLSGGVSAGRFDHVPAVLAALGVREVFHGIAQRPGRPMWFGVGAGGQAVFALPGNPVSVLVCLARYVIPALGRMVGRARPAPAQVGPGAGIRLREARSPVSCRSRSGTISKDGRWRSRGRPAGPATSSRSPARTASSSCRAGRRRIPRGSRFRSIAGRP